MWIIAYVVGLIIASGAMTAYTWYASKRAADRPIGFPWTWRRVRGVPLSVEVGAVAAVAVSAVLAGLSLNASPHHAGPGILLYLAAVLFPSEVVRYRHNRNAGT